MNTSTVLIHAGFIILTLVFFGLLIAEIRKALEHDKNQKRRVTLRLVAGLSVWAIFLSIWSGFGKMSDFSIFPLNVLPVFAIPLITILVLTFSKTTAGILRTIPAQNLVRLQGFRFFVELLLWGLYSLNQMPVQMSFEGRNFDVLSGLTAPFVAYWISKQKLSKTGILVWNLLCFGLLLNILGVAVTSMPTPFRVFMNEPSNTIVTIFPISWLPGFLVPLAYGLHFLSLRQLALQKSDTGRQPVSPVSKAT